MDKDVGGHVLQGCDGLGSQHLLGLGSLDTHPAQDLELLVASRVRNVDLEQETVALGFRKRVNALGLHRVLGGDDAEGVRGREGLSCDGHLFLGHQLEHRRLDLGRSSVDLVGQHEVDEDRAELDVESLLGGRVDAGADDVGGDEVRGELHSGEVTAEDRRERAHRQGLGDTGDTFQKDVAPGQHTDHELFDHALLADDDPLDLPDGLPDEASGLVIGHRGVLVALADVLTIRVVLGAH